MELNHKRQAVLPAVVEPTAVSPVAEVVHAVSLYHSEQDLDRRVEILNTEIVIVDFETGVATTESVLAVRSIFAEQVDQPGYSVPVLSALTPQNLIGLIREKDEGSVDQTTEGLLQATDLIQQTAQSDLDIASGSEDDFRRELMREVAERLGDDLSSTGKDELILSIDAWMTRVLLEEIDEDHPELAEILGSMASQFTSFRKKIEWDR
jgi:hypothetical protein